MLQREGKAGVKTLLVLLMLATAPRSWATTLQKSSSRRLRRQQESLLRLEEAAAAGFPCTQQGQRRKPWPKEEQRRILRRQWKAGKPRTKVHMLATQGGGSSRRPRRRSSSGETCGESRTQLCPAGAAAVGSAKPSKETADSGFGHHQKE
jgi:hypothetical protein